MADVRNQLTEDLTVKAASTAAVAADPALVVVVSPNNTVATKETRAATPTQTSVANSITTVSLLASNANRLGATIFNEDTVSTGATLKVKLGATASATSFTVAIVAQGYYEVPFGYTGAIDGIASAATGSARITELT